MKEIGKVVKLQTMSMVKRLYTRSTAKKKLTRKKKVFYTIEWKLSKKIRQKSSK